MRVFVSTSQTLTACSSHVSLNPPTFLGASLDLIHRITHGKLGEGAILRFEGISRLGQCLSVLRGNCHD